MATISSPAAHVAVVAALLLSGIGVGLTVDSASAVDKCVSAPGAAASRGRHWYYRIDRLRHRKCWYLHATVRLPKYAAVKLRHAGNGKAISARRGLRAALSKPVPSVATPQLSSTATPQATNAAPAPQPTPDTSNSLSEAASTQPAPPHVTILTVKPVRAPFVDMTSASQAAIPEPPMPQIAPSNGSVPVDRDAKTASGANPAVPGVTDAVHNASAPADTATTASGRTPPADLLFLLALALGIAAALIALCRKMADLTRTPRLSDHPDDAWRRVIREEDAPFLVRQEPRESTGLAANEWIEQSPPLQADLPAARPRDGEPGHSDQVGRPLKGVGLALRIWRQARESITQT